MWRMPATLELNLSSVDGRVPQHTTLWKGSEPLGKAFLRFLGLMLLGALTLFECPMDLTPQGIKLLQTVLVIDVRVTIWKLPFVCCPASTSAPTCITCRCTSAPVVTRQKHFRSTLRRVYSYPQTVDQVGPPLSRHLSICRTARLALGLDAYMEAVREAISAFYDNWTLVFVISST